MNTRILFVDDEPNVLEAFSRSLRKDFDVAVAKSGAEGLVVIEKDGPFAVIVSDMRMPGMDGIQFLGKVRDLHPETVRVMLTGNADQQTATDAVNKGSIFRFLTKPCPPEVMIQTLTASLDQYRLVTSEKQLLEQTLNKSLEVLVDILAIVNPTAFSRSARVKKMAREIAESLNVNNCWEVEAAAMLSQIGCVTVPEEILRKISYNVPLSNKETGLYNQHPQIGHDLIARIPRMETVADIVADQNLRFSDESVHVKQSIGIDEPRLGARILKAVLDLDKLMIDGSSRQNAFKELSTRVGWYDPAVLTALQDIIDLSVDEYESFEMCVSDLKSGMVLDGPLNSARGSTLLPSGQEITTSLILRLANLVEAGIILDTIRVNVPVQHSRSIAVWQANQKQGL
ncbi:MAG: HD domain-containing phosphohydrolase [Pyrinomonadaceae bacterium]